MLSGLVSTLVAGCSAEPVTVTSAEDLTAEDRETCRALIADVPDTLGERERRDIEPPDALGAAWGDPAIVMTCGGEAPTLSPTAVCEEANGVGYFVDDASLRDESADVTLVTVGYDPIITVVVPAEQRPEGVAAATAGLAAAVEEHTELIRGCL
ncbi:DUF3515 family protein [Nocardioides sp.]|uniref:DUF3515 family protein n=1 Tax=Nocardioides sp. TaxID=35761 RepID=UPI002ED0A9AC